MSDAMISSFDDIHSFEFIDLIFNEYHSIWYNIQWYDIHFYNEMSDDMIWYMMNGDSACIRFWQPGSYGHW